MTTRTPDRHGNVIAEEGVTRCDCGCKYWKADRCIDCGQKPPATPDPRRGMSFTHARMLDTAWVPGPGQKYADGPKVRCVVTKTSPTTVWFRTVHGGRYSMPRTTWDTTYATQV